MLAQQTVVTTAMQQQVNQQHQQYLPQQHLQPQHSQQQQGQQQQQMYLQHQQDLQQQQQQQLQQQQQQQQFLSMQQPQNGQLLYPGSMQPHVMYQMTTQMGNGQGGVMTAPQQHYPGSQLQHQVLYQSASGGGPWATSVAPGQAQMYQVPISGMGMPAGMQAYPSQMVGQQQMYIMTQSPVQSQVMQMSQGQGQGQQPLYQQPHS